MNILITGGAGFIGGNLAGHFAKRHEVTIFDSFEREGSVQNAAWLKHKHPSIAIVKGRILDEHHLVRLAKSADVIFHLAAQVAVTNSYADPKKDFLVNAYGTLLLLEAARKTKRVQLFVYASTNKVYGSLDGISRSKGINENQQLDFNSPYACSKGCADYYVREYSNTFGLQTVVLRQSCVYGPHQYGTEDQGWVAHFVRQAVKKQPIIFYGTGTQVRDLLYIDDLVDLYRRIVVYPKKLTGEVLNVGGGSARAVSLLGTVKEIERILKYQVIVRYKPARVGDQQWYVSNISKVKHMYCWQPTISIKNGLTGMIRWVLRHKESL